MKVVHICTEFAGIAKVGGLADVVHGLSKATAARGNKVNVILPYYSFIDYPIDSGNTTTFSFTIQNKSYTIRVAKLSIDSVEIRLIDCTNSKAFFDCSSPYALSYEKQLTNFLFFSRASIELVMREKEPTILHLHDWQVAIIPFLLQSNFPEHRAFIKGTVLTIHNLQYQGGCHRSYLEAVGIKLSSQDTNLHDIRDPKKYNLMRAGIAYSDQLTTVSPTYAKEIQTPAFSWWLEKDLSYYQAKLTGILNGVDPDIWNPLKDQYLSRNFSLQDTITDILQAKHSNKRYLQKKLSLPLSHAPLFTSITRLASQKAPHLILAGIQSALQRGAQYILIGNGNDETVNRSFKEVASHPNCFIYLGYDEELAHLAYGACDALFIPSLFEPCGLTQLIAMRYGTLPIARRVGGLKDTVFDNTNGFCFEEPKKDVVDALFDRVINQFLNEPIKWERMMKNALHLDSTWDLSADRYIEIYDKLWNNL